MKFLTLAAFCTIACAAIATAQVPSLINYQGRLTDANGDPVTGSKNFAISIYDAATNGTLLYTETIGAVTLDDNGVYSFQFGGTGTSNTLVTETVATTDGTSTTFQKVLANSPVVANSVSVSDGTYTWSQSAGSSNEDQFGVAYSTSLRRVTANYYNGAPAAGRTITATYRYGTSGITGALSSGAEHWMAVSVDGTTQGVRQRVLAVPFAQRAAQAASALTAADVEDGVITSNKLAPGAASINLQSEGIAGISSGGIVMSLGENEELAKDGYVRVGQAKLASGAEWYEMGINERPHARHAHSAVWTGTEMIIWGGRYTSNSSHIEISTGGRYNPTTNTWRATSQIGAPSARSYHTAVWTGSEMIIWGGWTPGGTNTGARYNPVTDTWSPMTTTGAPEGRNRHVAVWTGTRMIVWGTSNGGGIYDPEKDSWISINTTSAPLSTFNLTAVWTGTEMIVWGGRRDDTNLYYNIGGRYNPTTNSWAPTNSVGAPTARHGHSAVWTGTEMIIYGGGITWGRTGNSTNYFGDGAKYNPVTNTWTSMHTGAGRMFHSAVWTGTEMIVSSGYNGTTTDSGHWSYSPSQNGWRALGNISSFVNSSFHTGIWTGSEYYIFGGEGGDSYNNTYGYTLPVPVVYYKKY